MFWILSGLHEVRRAINRAKMFIQKSDKASDTSKFFLDRGDFTVNISSKQVTSNCRFSYISSWQQTKLAVGESVSRKLVEITLAWSVFRRKQTAHGWSFCKFWCLKSLSCRASSAKEKKQYGPRHFLKIGVEKKANKHPWLWAVWDGLIQ